jgi:hypothetical protein
MNLIGSERNGSWSEYLPQDIEGEEEFKEK